MSWIRLKPLKNGLDIKPEWPKEGQEVLIWYPRYKAVIMAKYNKGTFVTDPDCCCSCDGSEYGDEITHWQSLPSEPFKHVEGECTFKECVKYCPSLEEE